MKIYRARYLLPVGRPLVEDGALLVEGRVIRDIGSWQDLVAAHPRAAVFAYEDAVILPPLVNAHTHLELSAYPTWDGAHQDQPAWNDFVSWIQHLILYKRSLPNENVSFAIRNGLNACMRSGCGAVGDVLSCYADYSTYQDTPLLGRVYFEILGIDSMTARKQLKVLDEVIAAAPFGNFAAGLSPHALYTLAPDVLNIVLGHVRLRQWPIMMHLAESPEEVDFMSGATGPIADRLYPFVAWQNHVPLPSGLRPVPYLMKHAPLPKPLALVHGVQVNELEMPQLKAAGVHVVLCPRSNARLGVGKAPVARYHAAGIKLALGTDSLASNDSLSIWDELAFARSCFPGALAPATWIEIATTGGAEALGLGNRLGCLDVESEANFQVVSIPHGANSFTLAEALCASGEAISVQALFLGGENVLLPS